jgi:hypothetical protein
MKILYLLVLVYSGVLRDFADLDAFLGSFASADLRCCTRHLVFAMSQNGDQLAHDFSRSQFCETTLMVRCSIFAVIRKLCLKYIARIPFLQDIACCTAQLSKCSTYTMFTYAAGKENSQFTQCNMVRSNRKL